jgi:twitching motility protein PilJ
LPIWQKLLLIAGAFTLPVIVAVGLLIGEQNARINVVLGELQGVSYLRPIQDLQDMLQTYRLHATNAAQGDINAARERDATVVAIDRLIEALEAVDRRHGEEMGVSGEIATIRREWERVKSEIGGANVLSMLAIIADLLENHLEPLYITVADNSNLTFDPALEISYLVQFAVRDLPPGVGRVGALRTVGRTVVADGVITPEERRTLDTTYTRAVDAANRKFASIDRARRASPYVDARLTEVDEAARAAVFGLIDAFGANIVNVETPRLTFEQASAYTNPRPLQKRLGEVVLDTIESLLVQRVARLQQGQLVSLVMLALALALTFALVGTVTRRIVTPIGQLFSASQKLATGDLSMQVEVASLDEVGQLSAVFNEAVVQLREASNRQALEIERSRALQGNIAEFLNVAMDIADGDLTKRGAVTEDVLGNVIDAINLMVEELGATLQQVQRAAFDVDIRSDNMLQATENIAEQAQAQLVEAQRVREVIASVANAIQVMADNAAQSARAAERTLEASEKGQLAVSETLEGMQDIQHEVESVARSVVELSERSEAISEIIDSITTISSQINLLALSAALEAAGAGEAGARFATVANEVRELANASAQATRQITAIIHQVRSSVSSVVDEVEASSDKVALRSKVALIAKERLEEIARISRESAQLASSISSATGAQVARVSEVGQAVTRMVRLSENTQQSVLEGREAAGTLKQLAEQLTRSLARFRLT